MPPPFCTSGERQRGEKVPWTSVEVNPVGWYSVTEHHSIAFMAELSSGMKMTYPSMNENTNKKKTKKASAASLS